MKSIPEKEFTFTFSRSSGAGGQNVNKLNTKVTLHWEIDSSKSCTNELKERFKSKYRQYLFDGIFICKSQRYRTQKRNIKDCIEKLSAMIRSVENPAKKRVPTKPTKNSVRRRLQSKNIRSIVKKLRSEKF